MSIEVMALGRPPFETLLFFKTESAGKKFKSPPLQSGELMTSALRLRVFAGVSALMYALGCG